MSSIPTLDLDQIQDVVKVSDGKARHLKETCLWALDQCNHSVGVSLRVDQDHGSSTWLIQWDDKNINIAAIRRSYNQDDATQFGAEAVALLISIKITEFDAVERSMTKSGIDYWLGYSSDGPDKPFQRASRLEISGIFEESKTNKVSSRVKSKTAQTHPTDLFSPAYVVVVEFSTPYATVHLKK